MSIIISSLFLSLAASALALPSIRSRTVTSLNQADFEQAQERDTTAVRAFSSTEIKTSCGQCLFVNELSGDFRANLNPIQVAACNGSTGQLWDIITSGNHENIPGTMLVVNTLTQACMNFDPRRAAGDTVIMFSCGGRADGTGIVTDSQTFPFNGSAGPLALSPSNAVGTCFTVTSTNVVDEAACNAADTNQAFTFAGSSDSVSASTQSTSSTAIVPVTASSSVITLAIAAPSSVSMTTIPLIPTTTSPAAIASTTAPSTLSTSGILTFSPTTPISVSGAGGILQPSAVAESNPRDNTATRFLSSVSIKAPNGDCLFINPLAGDFRENLIPIQTIECTGSPNELFDVITAGIHNDVPGSALIVSSLTQGCLNFDPRRAAGDTVIMFSCGGRADGGGTVTNSQLFPFNATQGAATTLSLTLEPENDVGICLDIDSTGRLDSAPCTNDGSQLFTIG